MSSDIRRCRDFQAFAAIYILSKSGPHGGGRVRVMEAGRRRGGNVVRKTASPLPHGETIRCHGRAFVRASETMACSSLTVDAEAWRGDEVDRKGARCGFYRTAPRDSWASQADRGLYTKLGSRIVDRSRVMDDIDTAAMLQTLDKEIRRGELGFEEGSWRAVTGRRSERTPRGKCHQRHHPNVNTKDGDAIWIDSPDSRRSPLS
jgi:hypothetical protein